MKCGKCGRELQNSRSRQLGYGPVCYRSMTGGGNKKHVQYKERGHPSDDFFNYEVPGQMSIDDYLQMISTE